MCKTFLKTDLMATYKIPILCYIHITQIITALHIVCFKKSHQTKSIKQYHRKLNKPLYQEKMSYTDKVILKESSQTYLNSQW